MGVRAMFVSLRQWSSTISCRPLKSYPMINLASPLDGQDVDGLFLLVRREDDSPATYPRSAQPALTGEHVREPRILWRVADLLQTLNHALLRLAIQPVEILRRAIRQADLVSHRPRVRR